MFKNILIGILVVVVIALGVFMLTSNRPFVENPGIVSGPGPVIMAIKPSPVRQNAEVTIEGSFAEEGNIISIGNDAGNFQNYYKRFTLPSSRMGTMIKFVPEEYGIVSDEQAAGGGWLTVIDSKSGKNSNSVLFVVN